MVGNVSPLVHRSSFELFVGCMQSGKSRRLLERLDKLSFVPNCRIVAFKPRIDTRDEHIKSRFGSLSLRSVAVDESNPKDMFVHISPDVDIVAIDEVNLFGPGIVSVVEELLLLGKQIIAAGLDTDFRGEPFPQMAVLLSIATHVEKLHGVCQFPGCTSMATRTQRLIGGLPAPYSSPLIMIEGEDAQYQCRCIKHHEVPGKLSKGVFPSKV